MWFCTLAFCSQEKIVNRIIAKVNGYKKSNYKENKGAPKLKNRHWFFRTKTLASLLFTWCAANLELFHSLWSWFLINWNDQLYVLSAWNEDQMDQRFCLQAYLGLRGSRRHLCSFAQLIGLRSHLRKRVVSLSKLVST
jgi:hypothetical protein